MSLQLTARQLEAAKQLVKDPLWRLNNLYKITNKDGKQLHFKMNWAQTQLYSNIWYNNVILKARQLGMSTLITLMLLDRCFWN